ncbi:TIGR03756 family integrating conjugative element protein [Ursidibacter sp. B-7004-1]
MFSKKIHHFYSYLILSCSLPLYLTPSTTQAIGNEINGATIASAIGDNSCMNYQAVGVCFWLKCTYWKCSVKTSTKISHFIPEVVVSTYNHDNHSPWTEVQQLNKGAMGGQHQTPSKMYTQYTFKNGEAIGHPGGFVLQAIGSSGYTCESQTTGYVPYFLSSLDFFAWNLGMPEMFYPESTTPTMREVKANGDLWGNIYPRSGSVTQTHDYKAAAVVAQRIADIISRNGQLHIYYPLTKKNSRDGKWYPKEVEEGDKKTHRWQMLSPKTENSCSIFPDGGTSSTYSDKLSTTENYSWALWRPYACCKKRGQVFLGNTDWISTHTQ